MTFSVVYKKNNDMDDIPTCADIVTQRFEGIGGSLSGLELLQKIQPAGKTEITAVYTSTPSNMYTCSTGEVLQNTTCSKCIICLFTVFVPMKVYYL